MLALSARRPLARLLIRPALQPCSSKHLGIVFAIGVLGFIPPAGALAASNASLADMISGIHLGLVFNGAEWNKTVEAGTVRFC